MITLAVTNHNESSAALFFDNDVIAVTEERFSRKKNQGGFPTESVRWVLDEAGIKLEDCDEIAYCTVGSTYPKPEQYDEIVRDLLFQPEAYKQRVILHRMATECVYNDRAIDGFRKWLQMNDVGKNVFVSYVDHHLAHARSVANFYGYDDALIFTCDGKGGFESSAVWKIEHGSLAQQSTSGSHNSLGYLYGNFTIALGYSAERHEGKLTGLASYSEAPNDYQDFNPFVVDRGVIRLRSIEGRYMPFFDRSNDSWIRQPELIKRLESLTATESSAMAQQILEDVVLEWIAQNLDNKVPRIYLSGGVFGNVKLNQRINEKFNQKIVCVNPAMGDMGLVLGGKTCEGFAISESRGMYLGPNYTDRRFVGLIDRKKYNIKQYDAVENMVTEMINLFDRKSPIGLFHGAMEFGPRALCHRSIIYPADDITANEMLNRKLQRSDFMPFAPVVLDTDAAKYFVGYKKDVTAEYMTITYQCTSDFIDRAPAAVHVDGSARPQILTEKREPWVYDILRTYILKTGAACLMNTSFNNHEEPIVCNWDDALSSLDRGNVDAIVSSNVIITRRG